jgi:hypothetical protein
MMSSVPDQAGDKPATNDGSVFLLAEYRELRAEILKRSEMQHQLISFSLAALGALMAVGLRDSPTALLIYPIVTLGLAIGWAYHDLQIAQLGLYIRYRIETRLVGSRGWEHAIALQVASKEIGHLARLATRGVFWTSAVLTLLLYVSRRSAPWPSTIPALGIEDLVLVVSVVATVSMFVVMRNRDDAVKEIERSMAADPGDRAAGD